MYKPTSSVIIKLTMELATEFADMQPVPGERVLKTKHIEHLRGHLLAGRFQMPRWAKAQAKPGSDVEKLLQRGVWYRLDGQHSSKLLASLTKDEFPRGLDVLIESYEVETVKELRDLYDVFNHPASTRTNADKLHMHLEQCGPPHVSETIVSRALKGVDAGIRSTRGDDPRRGLLVANARERGAMLHDYDVRSFVQFVAEFASTKHSAFLKQGGIVAEMYLSWHTSKDRAHEFWSYVFNENHPDSFHDTRTLAEELKKIASGKRGRPRTWYVNRAGKAWRGFFRRWDLDQPGQHGHEQPPMSTD